MKAGRERSPCPSSPGDESARAAPLPGVYFFFILFRLLMTIAATMMTPLMTVCVYV